VTENPNLFEPCCFGSPETPDLKVEWLWHGYLARGGITLLTSLWKAGKTTLLSALITKMQSGGLFAGFPLQASRVAVVSEEPAQLWHERNPRLAQGTHIRYYFQPIAGAPSLEQWERLVASLQRDRERDRIDLAVIDTLGTFLPAGAESQRDAMLRALAPLQQLAATGASLLLLHHPRKGDPPLGQAARGSGALSGTVDISIEMKCLVRPDLNDRRRRLVGFSRFASTPRDMVIELNADRADYTPRGTPTDEECRGLWPDLTELLQHSNRKLTRDEILSRWPRPDTKPHETTLWRWLEWGVAQGRFAKEGDGRRSRPYRYWWAELEVVHGELEELGDILPDLLRPRKKPRKETARSGSSNPYGG